MCRVFELGMLMFTVAVFYWFFASLAAVFCFQTVRVAILWIVMHYLIALVYFS